LNWFKSFKFESQDGLVKIDFLFEVCCLLAVARVDVDFVLLKLNRFNDEVDADDLRLRLDIVSNYFFSQLMSVIGFNSNNFAICCLSKSNYFIFK